MKNQKNQNNHSALSWIIIRLWASIMEAYLKLVPTQTSQNLLRKTLFWDEWIFFKWKIKLLYHYHNTSKNIYKKGTGNWLLNLTADWTHLDEQKKMTLGPICRNSDFTIWSMLLQSCCFSIISFSPSPLPQPYFVLLLFLPDVLPHISLNLQ